ncbi:selenium-dependent molybdenum cofactor biosynthesis protein YqeB [Dorea sp. D27]|uniref:selenium-dependent molybdenum cofactor biosynthesis protein YqeB n=1 Tax=Dorea sp. D27 TaxID=658665 RepID=UPI0006735DC1|nr:selenium-dependent molybdenum cofactor biosynthesis protein YqeB [Dorea sp. D27]KMZ53522.1 selenium-dependent molybdenum hydroxylase system protein, YqeB family [Dorea sp. D27]
MNVLIKGAGDLATGIAYELHLQGHRIMMTERAVPLTVRRTVAMSRAVYDGRATVEGMTGVCVRNMKEAAGVMDNGDVAVIVDEAADIRKEYRPDVLVDAILAKRNTGTSLEDAPLVIAAGPGFTAGVDCHCVIETKRGDTLGRVIWEGNAIPNTGVPGEVGGYSRERLIQAAGDGAMEPKAAIGDRVEKGQIVAETGGEPVYAKMSGMVRGMLQRGVPVQKGMKIGDIDARPDHRYCVTISDKARCVGAGTVHAMEQYCGAYAIVVLAAGQGVRFGGNKLLEEVEGRPLYAHLLDTLTELPHVWKAVVTGCGPVAEGAARRGFAVVENREPEKGSSHSMQLGLKKCMDTLPFLKGVLFTVCDQPELTAGTFVKLLEAAGRNPGRIVRAACGAQGGNPVVWDLIYAQELLALDGDKGGRPVMEKHAKEIILIGIEKKELRDIDRKSDLTEGL